MTQTAVYDGFSLCHIIWRFPAFLHDGLFLVCPYNQKLEHCVDGQGEQRRHRRLSARDGKWQIWRDGRCRISVLPKHDSVLYSSSRYPRALGRCLLQVHSWQYWIRYTSDGVSSRSICHRVSIIDARTLATSNSPSQAIIR
jgi:hypothetical protein